MPANDTLKTVLENIQTKVSAQVFVAYFSELHLEIKSETSFKVICKNAFTKQVIETRYFQTLLTAFKNVTGKNDIELLFEVGFSTNKSSNDPIQHPSNLFATATTSVQRQTDIGIQKRIQSSFLNPKYTFDSLIVGPMNQLGFAAAQAIVDSPGTAYNPFFIYGNVGLGKTHLMQAIGNEILIRNPDAKVLYCSTESFLNEMVTGIRMKNTQQFREKYRALDALLLDDIRFLSNKEMLQEEFFNTFNTLYQSGKQIIIASDRPPGEIAHLADRIRSRFEGGLVADIKNPGLETRVAIIQKKLGDRGEFLPDPVIYMIAEAVDSNIRELEGILLKASILSKTSGDISIDDIRGILGDKARTARKKVNPLDIMNAVCNELEVSLKDVKSAKRQYDIAYARQLCMFLLKEILNLPLVKIARHVGRSDHTTVMHGINKIFKMMEKNQEVTNLISEIKAKIQTV